MGFRALSKASSRDDKTAVPRGRGAEHQDVEIAVKAKVLEAVVKN